MSFPVTATTAASYGTGHGTRSVAAQPQVGARNARLIPREVWDRYEKKIEELYVTAEHPLTLKQLKERMFQDHVFVAS